MNRVFLLLLLFLSSFSLPAQVIAFKDAEKVPPYGFKKDSNGILYILALAGSLEDVNFFHDTPIQFVNNQYETVLLKYDEQLNYIGFWPIGTSVFLGPAANQFKNCWVKHYFPSAEDSVIYFTGAYSYKNLALDVYVNTVFISAIGMYDGQLRFFKYMPPPAVGPGDSYIKRIESTGLVVSSDDWFGVSFLGYDFYDGVGLNPDMYDIQNTIKKDEVFIAKYDKQTGNFINAVNVGDNPQPDYFDLLPQLRIDSNNNLYISYTNYNIGYKSTLKKYNDSLNLLETYSPTGGVNFWIKDFFIENNKIYGVALFKGNVNFSSQTYSSNSGTNYSYAVFETDLSLNGSIKVITPFTGNEPPEDRNASIIVQDGKIHFVMLSWFNQALALNEIQDNDYILNCNLRYNVTGVSYDSTWNIRYTYNFGQTGTGGGGLAAIHEPKIFMTNILGLTLVQTYLHGERTLVPDGTTTTNSQDAGSHVAVLIGDCSDLYLSPRIQNDTIFANNYSDAIYNWYKLPDIGTSISNQYFHAALDTGFYIVKMALESCNITDTIHVDTLTVPQFTESNILAYPNPAMDMISFDMLQGPVDNLKIMTLYGTVVLIINNYQPQTPVSLAGIQAGSYKVVINYTSGAQDAKVIIISN